MSRLIIIPQYPTKMRYQEWWFTEFPKQYGKFFDEVIVIGHATSMRSSPYAGFAPVETACQFETQQIYDYLQFPLRDDDILLLNDLSFPGLFPLLLFHKKPSKCYAICHATSKNAYDYYQSKRDIKYPIEKNIAKLFDGIFVATGYHKKKLGWPNIWVTPFPNPPMMSTVTKEEKRIPVVSLSRPGVQKQNRRFEKALEKEGLTINRPRCQTWGEYYTALAHSTICLITAKEETYGYLAIEAILHGCIPVAPRAFSYPELIPEEYLYEPTSVGGCLDIISNIFTGTLPIPPLLTFRQAEKFFEVTLNIMQNV